MGRHDEHYRVHGAQGINEHAPVLTNGLGMIEETIYRFTLTSADTNLVKNGNGIRMRLRLPIEDWLNANGHTKQIEYGLNAIVVEFTDAKAALHFKMRFVEGDDSFS
jgi:hypothetical protein